MERMWSCRSFIKETDELNSVFQLRSILVAFYKPASLSVLGVPVLFALSSVTFTVNFMNEFHTPN